MANTADGKFVVVRGNTRISGKLHERREDAEKEVQHLTESVTPQPTPSEYSVRQVLQG